ncbi:MAG TPA: hypothetical protein VF658_21085 [Pyrinomonadaceae bacterium]|jgi:hypothetical protein
MLSRTGLFPADLKVQGRELSALARTCFLNALSAATGKLKAQGRNSP